MIMARPSEAADEGQFACKVCNRANSTHNNEIVVCDKCASPYHRMCHKPIVDEIVIQVPDVRWMCNDCELKNGGTQPLKTGVAASKYEPAIRKIYLSSLPKSQLIALVQYAESLNPNLPLYSPQTEDVVRRMQQDAAYQKARGNAPGYINYEDTLVDIIREHPGGLELTQIWSEVQLKHKQRVDSSFKHSASRALQRVLRKGRVMQIENKYHINGEYEPGRKNVLGTLQFDDSVMFGIGPLRMALNSEDYVLEECEAFSHQVY